MRWSHRCYAALLAGSLLLPLSSTDARAEGGRVKPGKYTVADEKGAQIGELWVSGALAHFRAKPPGQHPSAKKVQAKLAELRAAKVIMSNREEKKPDGTVVMVNQVVERDKPDFGNAILDSFRQTFIGYQWNPVEALFIVVPAAEAATKKLPAVNVFVDYTGTGLTAFKFPSERAYVSFSGPPGGPLGLVVEAPGKSVANGIDLSVIAKERCGATAMISKPQSIVFSGANRPAISCVYGEAVARAEHLLIGITVGKEGVLIDAYQSAGKNGPSPPVELKKKLAFLSKLDIIP